MFIISDPCTWKSCKNGGMCKVINGNAKCLCEEPYYGEFCDSIRGGCLEKYRETFFQTFFSMNL